MAQVKVKKSEVEKGKAKQVKVGGELVALFHTEGDEWYALGDICTHEQCNLSFDGGKLEGYLAECDCHGSKFDIRTGKVMLPPAIEDEKTFKVTDAGEEVIVEA